MYSKRGKRAGRFGPAILAVMLAAGLLAGCGLERPEPDPAKSSPPAVTAPAPTPTPVPTPVSEPEPTPAASLAERTLSDMTLWEKICQLFIVYPSDLTGVAKVTAAGETTRAALAEYPVGGLLYDKSNLVTWEAGEEDALRRAVLFQDSSDPHLRRGGGTGEPLDGHHRHHPDRPHAGL